MRGEKIEGEERKRKNKEGYTCQPNSMLYASVCIYTGLKFGNFWKSGERERAPNDEDQKDVSF